MRVPERDSHTCRATAAQAVERARAAPRIPRICILGTGYMGMLIWALFSHNSHPGDHSASHPGEFYREFQTG